MRCFGTQTGKQMVKNTTFAFVFICFSFVQSVHAHPDSDKQRCSEPIVNLVGRHFNISDFSYPRDGMYPSAENGGVITAGACKVWPKNNAITIAAFAYDDDSEINGKSLVVVMVDNRKNKIISAYKGAQIDFAGFYVAQDGLQIDTARYDLAPGIRAIGLDVTETYNPNCGDGGAGPARTLFVQDGGMIRPVLENFYTSTWSLVQGNKCGAGDEEIVSEYLSYSIEISKAATNGYANLIITATLSYDNGDKPKQKPFQYELHYDGNRYQNSGGGTEFANWQNDSRPDKWRNK